MNSRHHWGNKRTIRVLKVLAEIGVIERTRSDADHWTWFFLVKGFLDKCMERMLRALEVIRARLRIFRAVVSPPRRVPRRTTVT